MFHELVVQVMYLSKFKSTHESCCRQVLEKEKKERDNAQGDVFERTLQLRGIYFAILF